MHIFECIGPDFHFDILVVLYIIYERFDFFTVWVSQNEINFDCAIT